VDLSNKLLDLLSEQEFAALGPHLMSRELAPHAVLYDRGAPITHAFFPVRGLISLVVPMRNGDAVEAGMVGIDGVAGGCAATSVGHARHRATVQVPGEARVIEIEALRGFISQRHGVWKLLSRHQDALLVQAQQSTACNALHGMEGRLAKWLLFARDRTRSTSLPLTQEYMAQMLGVQRTRYRAAHMASKVED